MRKLFALILAVMISVCMAVTAFAVTPTIKVPSVKIPAVKVPEIKVSDSFWDKWFAEHPIVINIVDSYERVAFDLDYSAGGHDGIYHRRAAGGK